MNKENLTILMNFLLVNDLPFEMMDYRSETDLTPELPYGPFKLTKDAIDAGLNQCNTAGCGVGWAPFVVPPKPEHYTGDGTLYDPIAVNYERYVESEFGVSGYSTAFAFLFDSGWSEWDNTRQGVSFRIHDYITDRTFFKLFEDPAVEDFYENHGEAYEKAKADWLATVEHS